MENWTKSWGFSGLVGEWNCEVWGGHSNKIQERFNRLIEVLELILPLLNSLHRLHKAYIDINLLGEEVQLNGTIKEVGFFEDLALDATSLNDLVSALKKVTQNYPHCLVTKVDIELDTMVLEDSGIIILPNSSNLFLGMDNKAEIDQEVNVNIYVCFSTYIDVWLKKTFNENGLLRDNQEASKRNHPHLKKFLQGLEESLQVQLKVGESRYYSKYLHRTGFIDI